MTEKFYFLYEHQHHYGLLPFLLCVLEKMGQFFVSIQRFRSRNRPRMYFFTDMLRDFLMLDLIRRLNLVSHKLLSMAFAHFLAWHWCILLWRNAGHFQPDGKNQQRLSMLNFEKDNLCTDKGIVGLLCLCLLQNHSYSTFLP